ncbi:hypothetical protein TNCV_4635561 [Trichonephila clavipes]|nr:hypothetical protein TNCV_4635561 [Trichonephila clavipes]
MTGHLVELHGGLNILKEYYFYPKSRPQMNFLSRALPLLDKFESNIFLSYFSYHKQGRSYHRLSDTGPPNYRGSNMCNYSPTNRVPISKKGPEGILIQGPLRASYAGVHKPIVSFLEQNEIIEMTKSLSIVEINDDNDANN